MNNKSPEMIRMERKNILGNVVQIPTNVAIAVAPSIKKIGTMKAHSSESYYLVVKFQIGTTPIESEIFLARGTDGYGYAKEMFQSPIKRVWSSHRLRSFAECR